MASAVRAARRDRRGARGRRARLGKRLRQADRRREPPDRDPAPADEDGVSSTVVDSAPVRDARPGRACASTTCTWRWSAATRSASCSATGEVDLGVRERPRPTARCSVHHALRRRAGWTAAPAPSCCSTPSSSRTSTATARRRDPGPDGGGLGTDWISDWFADWDAGDALDPDFDFGDAARLRSAPRARCACSAPPAPAAASPRSSRPQAGRISLDVTLPSNGKTGAGPFETILTGEMRVRRAGRVRVRLTPTQPAPASSPPASASAPRSSSPTSPAGPPSSSSCAQPVSKET